ncbi:MULTISPECIES: TetR/AcrR family transcriptional regulator [unclassified Brevibacterium]|uniref:TetR/AcrR family transcriptional regulator n=1 Tax=unclassified Brevibacterium TaxID=2614124 RepID=UPI001865B458|nr:MULTISPECIES: TetR/AcrR family transcriptional regulator [unclassified Brevibacterium]
MDRWTRTHDALTQAALELFGEHGYDATGTAEIAKRAKVSEMTLFRHFPSKEALLLTDPFDPLIADAVRARPDCEPAMHALAEGIRMTWVELDSASLRALHARLRIIAEASSLRGAVEHNSMETIAALQAALTDRGYSATSSYVASTAMISGLSVALLEWARSEMTSLDDALGSALDTLGGR